MLRLPGTIQFIPPLQHLLDTLADTPIDLAAERAHVWKLLDGQQIPAIPTPGGETPAHQSLPITDSMRSASLVSRLSRLLCRVQHR